MIAYAGVASEADFEPPLVSALPASGILQIRSAMTPAIDIMTAAIKPATLNQMESAITGCEA
jgi:hypothetical protein